MTRLVHISDLHFGAVDAGVVAGLSGFIATAAPDLVVISGDLTMAARRREFEAARAFIQGLGAPVLAVPGNHDVSPFNLVQRFLDPFRRYRDYICPELEPVWRAPGMIVVGLNTTRRMALDWDWSHGRLNEGQIRHVGEVLEGAPDGDVAVVVAHHPFLGPESGEPVRTLRNARAALEAFQHYGVDLVLAGHLHLPYTRRASPPGEAGRLARLAAGRTAPVPSSTGEPPLVLQAGTATSTRLRGAPNAFNVIKVEAGRIALEAYEWRANAWLCVAGGAAGNGERAA